MPELELMRLVPLLACLATAWTLGSRVPTPEPGGRAVDAVIAYRRSWMADTTPVDACSVARHIGRDAAAHLAHGAVLVGATDTTCTARRLSCTAQAEKNVVVVDSVAAAAPAGVVVLTVRHGDYTHRETFRLAPSRSGGWTVRDVTLWGAIVSSPPPPRRSE